MQALVETQIKPYYETERFTLFCGDCRSVLPTLDACSVDSIVCDPPYELGFMGKGWDRSGIAYDVEVWRECLRVLKPGGHLLAFGGSRTYHRLACAIEDAGFEIRDQIQYLYGSGFPKSLNVSKNLREDGSVCTCNEQAEQKAQHDLRPMPDHDLSSALYSQDQSRQVLQSSMSEPGTPEHRTTRAKSQATGQQESRLEGRRNRVQEEGQLYGSAVCESAAMGKADGPQRRLLDGAPVNHGPDVRVSPDASGSRKPSGSQAIEQPANEPRTMADERGSQARGSWPLCSRCCKPILPEGIGSALKPAHEPIVVARKPFNTTLIKNVLLYGTGGLNIDGCRIEMSARDTAEIESMGGFGKKGYVRPRTEETFMQGTPNATAAVAHSLGRWPANVIHDGSDEVLAGFPETESGFKIGGQYAKEGMFAMNRDGEPCYNDKGSAARFFYCAKADQADRNEGCEDLPQTRRSEANMTSRAEREGRGERQDSATRNNHPTVKPTELMRYLCRLVTPPGGIVLDPFTGSGSTGKAAMLEGLRFIGIELSEDYCQLAQRRIEAVTKQGMLFT